jgi:hypothetical protein
VLTSNTCANTKRLRVHITHMNPQHRKRSQVLVVVVHYTELEHGMQLIQVVCPRAIGGIDCLFHQLVRNSVHLPNWFFNRIAFSISLLSPVEVWRAHVQSCAVNVLVLDQLHMTCLTER